MIRLDAFLRHPPESLSAFHPLGESPTYTEAANTLGRLAMAGPEAPDRILAVVLVGVRGSACLHAIRNLLPSVRHVLVVEPDPRVLRTLLVEHQQGKGSVRTDAVFIADVVRPYVGYSADTYLEIMQFIAQHGLRPEQCLLHIDPQSVGRLPKLYDALAATAIDLFFGGSQGICRLLVNMDPAGLSTFVSWADHLATCDQPLAALRFYELCRRTPIGAQVAGRAIDCILKLSAFELLGDWVPSLPVSVRAEMSDSAARSCGLFEQVTLACFEQNMATLGSHHPLLAERLRQHPLRGRLVGAFWRQAPVACVPQGTPILSRAEHAFLLEHEGAFLSELNPIGDPRAAIPFLTAARKAPAVVLGSLRRQDVLANLLRGRDDKGPTVYIVEEDFDYFARLTRIVNLDAAFSDPRVFWFLGENAVSECLAKVSGPVMHFGVTDARLADALENPGALAVAR